MRIASATDFPALPGLTSTDRSGVPSRIRGYFRVVPHRFRESADLEPNG